MTTPKKLPLLQLGSLGLTTVIALTGCQAINNLFDPGSVDYQSAGKTPTARLDVPPDLTQLEGDSRYVIPGVVSSAGGDITASGYYASARAGGAPAGAPMVDNAVAPNRLANMHIERDGSQRWLVIHASPETLWPRMKTFWQEAGFSLYIENQTTGVIETDWAENRAKIPQDFVRNALGKFIGSVNSTGERDKFRTRLERGDDGTTEIYISHRGAEEVLTGPQKDSTMWTARPSDPELEAIFLSKLMVYLGNSGESSESSAQEETTNTVNAAVNNTSPSRSEVVKTPADTHVAYLNVAENVDQTWRRVGLALDRVGFTVEDRDRSQGIYFVRYVDQTLDAKNKDTNKGFFGRLFSSNKKKDPSAAQYRIVVKAVAATSQVLVFNEAGQEEISDTADKILTLLDEQLR